MLTFFRHEWKLSVKTLLIWALSVGGMGLMCLLLYKSMESSMADMAESFASMGAFADAFGMSTLSIATMKGYFATEIGTIHTLGSCMFAASIATIVLSKEEDGHTAELTFTFPLTRVKIIAMKYAAVLFGLICFNVICGLCYELAFLVLGESGFGTDFLTFMGLQLLMNVEVAAICFVISAVNKKNRLGIGIAVALVLYVFDLMVRLIPDLKDAIFLSPLSYANATTIFSGAEIECAALVFGVAVVVVMAAVAGMIYAKRDLAS